MLVTCDVLSPQGSACQHPETPPAALRAAAVRSGRNRRWPALAVRRYRGLTAAAHGAQHRAAQGRGRQSLQQPETELPRDSETHPQLWTATGDPGRRLDGEVSVNPHGSTLPCAQSTETTPNPSADG